MARFLRLRLTCFYCGRGSSQKKVPGLEKFQCEHCDAENYLDENGEITDPPVHASSSARYAAPLDRQPSLDFESNPDSTFCKTCIQNQQIYAESLAEYYPTPTLANFTEYELAEARYRASLEERYPQVCEQCEPMARERVKEANYAAKTDHMRRIMERTSPELRHLKETAQWKLWISFLGGFMWALSWAGQIAWDLVGVLATHAEFNTGPHIQQTLLGAMEQLVLSRNISPNMTDLLLPYARSALVLGMLSSWWNPRLAERIKKKGGRMIGLWDYYLQQLIFLAVRGAMWYWLTTQYDVAQVEAAHLFMLFFSLVAIIKSHFTVRMDYKSKAIWQESPKSLLRQPPRQPSPIENTPTAHRRKRKGSPPPLFPIESLAAKPLPALSRSSAAPPPNYNAPSFQPVDAMDWAPTLPAPRPYASVTPRLPLTDSRNAPPKTSPALSIFSNLSPAKVADPKFFPSTDAHETGLESILERAFHIGGPPAEVRDLSVREEQHLGQKLDQEPRRTPIRISIGYHILALCAVVAAYGLLYPLPTAFETLPLDMLSLQQRRSIAFGLSALLTLRTVLTAAGERTVFLPVLETLTTAVFGGAVFGNLQLNGQMQVAVGQLALGVLGVTEMGLLGRDFVRLRV